MNHVNAERPAENGDNPTRHAIPESAAIRLGIHGESSENLDPSLEDHQDGVGQPRQSVVPEVDMAAFELQVLPGLPLEIAPPLLLPYERKAGARIVVAHPKAADPRQERGEENVRRHEMD